MKTIKKFAVCLFAVLVLCGCGSKDVEKVDANNDKSMFVQIERGDCWRVVYHRETKVMYAVSFGAYTYGNFTLLVNEDGTPMIYENFN